MSALVKRLKKWGGASVSNSSLGQPSEWLIDAIIGSASAAGLPVTPLSALGVPTVHACVNAVSRSIASIPLKLYRRKPSGGKELAMDHRLYSLLHDAPNDEMTSADFRRAVQANATLRNSGYAQIIRNGMGEVVALYPIENKDIRPDRSANGKLIYLVKNEQTDAAKILHIKGLTLNGISGLDSIGTARESIGLALALQDHGARYFANASTPSMGIEIPTNLSPTQLKDFADKWDAANTGANKHKRSILFGGAKFASIPQTNNEQSQFLEAKIYQDKCIAQTFGVPQIKAGITDAAHFNNVEQENQNYVTDTLMSWCKQWEQSLNQKLLTVAERSVYFFEFSLDGLLRGDAQTRASFYKTLIEAGVITRNEVREKENMNPADGLDRFVISQNVQLLDETGMPIAPAVVPSQPNEPEETE